MHDGRPETGLLRGGWLQLSVVHHVPVAAGADAHGAVVEALIVQDIGAPVGAAVALFAVGAIKRCQFPVKLPQLGRVRGLLAEESPACRCWK
jgi:hypothetical protein